MPGLRDDMNGNFHSYRDSDDKHGSPGQLNSSDFNDESNEWFRIISNFSQDIITIMSPEGICEYISQAVYPSLGYRPEELVGTCPLQLFHPKDQELICAQSVNINGGRVIGRLLHKNGEYVWFEISMQGMQDETGKLTALLSIGRDITERVQAELRLKLSEERFRSAFENAPIGMAMISPNGWMIRVNLALCDILGYSEQELLELSIDEITFPDDVHTHMSMFNKVLSDDIPNYSMVTRFIHKLGEMVWVMISVSSLMRDKNGNPVYVISQIQDITERKQLEKVGQQKEELIHRADKLSTIGQMVASITHEIRNPLTTIRGFAQLLSQKGDPLFQQYYQVMIEELDRANEIISNFLALSQNRIVMRKPSNLNDIICSIFPLLQADANMKGQYIELDLHDGMCSLLLNEKEIKQLLLNLARNGMEAMSRGGKLTISTRMLHNRLEMQISDTGCGIDKQALNKLFDPFYTTKEEGTGLGLPVCLSIIEKHKATVAVQSVVNKGTTFIVTFIV
jgi:PAS domain S-box-containing protein